MLSQAGAGDRWLRLAAEWCWAKIARPDELDAYQVKYSLAFLDTAPDEQRAAAAVERLRARRVDACCRWHR